MIHRFIILMIIVMVTLSSLGYDRYEVVGIKSHLNVRDQNGQVIGKLHNGEVIDVINIDGNKGFIKYTNSNGYKSYGYVSTEYIRKLSVQDSKGSNTGIVKSSASWLPKIKGWWILLFVALYIFIKRKQGYSMVWAILHLPDRIFYWLNQLQFFMQKPWRWMLHEPADIVISLHKYYVWVPINITLYVVSTPLRFLNAFYFNILDRSIHAIFDSMGEVILPTEYDMKYKKGWDYIWRWLLFLPLRLGFYLARVGICVFEGFICTVFDSIVPTLTLYHGTTPYAAQKITEDNNWQVGNGAYAGYGIYFGAQMRTARNYAQGVIVVSRVTLGWVENLNLHRYMRTLPTYKGEKGHRITQWAIDNHYTTIEWWREDRNWWEYCMVDHASGYDNPWRIRPLYVIKEYSASHHRIEGCIKLWFFPALLKLMLD